ncbi:MAG: S10 family peptidase [Rhizomicrobium sp.]
MRPVVILFGAAALAAVTMAFGKDAPSSTDQTPPPAPDQSSVFFKPTQSVTNGSVTVEGNTVSYQAVAGTLVVHAKDYDDVAGDTEKPKETKDSPAEASMFYVAYFRRGGDAGARPITFLFNGGPGSSTVWLHMGAFGPKRVVTLDDSHTPAAPYKIVNNDYSLLDASDLVFVDAPGTGFSRIAGKDKEKAFYGVDVDAHAFTEFVTEFLSKYSRWNSPKYLFGESYGTPRASVMSYDLQSDKSIDLNGVILLSQILNFDLSVDGPDANPGVDLPYEVAFPTYAATALYHHKVPGSIDNLQKFAQQAEHFAMTDYARALSVGASLSPAEKLAIANKMHAFTGLPVSYILKANLRIDGGEFEKMLQDDAGMTTGRLDTRFSGPTIDPLSKEADYDPQSAAISSAYVSAFNDYSRTVLKYGQDQVYNPEINVFKWWEFKHEQPNAGFAFPGSTNVMPDIATTMKTNPQLHVMVNGGYFDLATPYYEGWYEMHHLPIPEKLQNNIEFHYYPSGHMVYAHEESLKALHDNVANFIRNTENNKP